jgi:GMP reductase
MPKILQTKSIYYNDCNLIAQPAHENLKSRSDIPKDLRRIFVSPMSAVVGKTFVKEATSLGLSVGIHRFCDANSQIETFKSTSHDYSNSYVSIGLNDWDRVSLLKDYSSNWIIDCANGYLSTQIKSVIERLKKEANIHKLVIGNIHSKEGIEIYEELGEEIYDVYFRVGIACGSACSTSDATGVNRGQITELIECREYLDRKKLNNFKIIADGGIKNGNYASKAFGAGADFVMMGGFFSKAKEAETHIINDGTYWGGASSKQQELFGGKKRHSEGKVYKIDAELRPLNELVDELWGGISSCISYSGYNSLEKFIGNGVFEIKENSLPPGDRK